MKRVGNTFKIRPTVIGNVERIDVNETNAEIIGTSSFDVTTQRHNFAAPRILVNSQPEEITVDDPDYFIARSTGQNIVKLKDPTSFTPSKRINVYLRNNNFQERETARVRPFAGFAGTDILYVFTHWLENSLAKNVVETMTELFGDTVSTQQTRERFINKLLPLDWETTTEPIPQNNPNFVLKDVDFSGVALTESRFRENSSGMLYRGGALISPRDYIECAHWDWAPPTLSGRRTPNHAPETQLFWFLDKNNQIHERHVVGSSSVGVLKRSHHGEPLGFPPEILFTAKVDNVGDPVQWPAELEYPSDWDMSRRLNWGRSAQRPNGGFTFSTAMGGGDDPDLRLLTFNEDLPPDVVPFRIPGDDFILHTEAINALSYPRHNVLPTVHILPHQRIKVEDYIRVNWLRSTFQTEEPSIFPVMNTYFVPTIPAEKKGHSGSPSFLIYKEGGEYKTILLGLVTNAGLGTVISKHAWGPVLPLIKDAMYRSGSPHYNEYPKVADLSMFTPAENYIEWS